MKKIVLIGDQVCSDYSLVLSSILKDVAEVWSPSEVASSTVDVLAGLPEWVLKRQPDIVMIASGLLDTRCICYGEGERLVPLKQFERNVQCILKMILERSTAQPLWATITPVNRRRVEEDSEFGYDNETVSQYNEEAKAVARRLGVDVLDLYGIVKAASRAESWRPKGIRFDERGSDYIAGKVAERLREICAK